MVSNSRSVSDLAILLIYQVLLGLFRIFVTLGCGASGWEIYVDTIGRGGDAMKAGGRNNPWVNVALDNQVSIFFASQTGDGMTLRERAED